MTSTIILYCGGQMFGLPEASVYATKIEVQLQLAGLRYEKRQARPSDGPKGQLPWIDDAGELVADTTFIRAYLERTYGIDLDAGLSPHERAQAWAIERMLENQFNWILVYYRFLTPSNFAKGPAHWFDDAPEAMRADLRADTLTRARAKVEAAGLLRHRPEDVLALGQRTLDALAGLIGEKPFLFGNMPTGTDAFAFACLADLASGFFPSPLSDAMRRMPVLIDYVARMMARFFPAFAWELDAAA